MQLLPYWHVPSWWYLHGSRSTVWRIFTLAANFAHSTHARLWVVAQAEIDAARVRDLQLFTDEELRTLDEYFLDCASACGWRRRPRSGDRNKHSNPRWAFA